MPPRPADPDASPLLAPARAALALLADDAPDALRDGDALPRLVLDLLFARFAAARGLPLLAASAASPLPRAALARADAALAAVDFASLDVEHLGAVHEHLLARTDARRRAGAHYTPRALATPVVRDTLAPLLATLGPSPAPDAILALTVCDPAMGAGAFLLEACRQLGDALARSWAAHGRPADLSSRDDLTFAARRLVARRCLHGVDQDARAVDLARRSLWLEARGDGDPADYLARSLREGDALVGALAMDDAAQEAAERAARDATAEGERPVRCFHWERAWPEVFAAGGFAAVLGNPPWVSYAGRAAQPLTAARRRWYDATFAAFARYKNLQGLFVERAAALLRPGGRLGLVLPSSMAELAGYGPTRAAHDRYAACDDELPDLGEDGFLGVFQPSMVLRSTARAAVLAAGDPAPWPIERPDVDDEARGLLARLSGPPFPASTFGERGLHTFGDDVAHLRPAPDATHRVPLRVGSDITAFRRGPPSTYADAAWFGARLRGDDAWRAVDVLIRQTARVPIAVTADGVGFRNSLLAGFASEPYPAGCLVAYLNATPVRWWHYYSHRDARLGMPQVKIGHLRALPAPPTAVVATLTAMGDALSARNGGVTEAEQRAIDDAVMDAFGLTAAERSRVARDAARWR